MKKQNRNRWFALVLCVLLAAGALSGCGNVQELASGGVGEFPVTINEVKISARPAKAVVLSPSLADVVLALGYERQLAGGSDDCTQDSLQALQKVSASDAQAILDLSPDLVLAEELDEGVASRLQEANVPVLSLAPATDREDFERLYSQMATALAGEGAGAEAGLKCARSIFLTMDDISRITQSDTVTTACYLYDTENSAVTGDQFGTLVMTYAGLTNVFKSQNNGEYDFDTLKLSNPNVIFCPEGVKEQIEGNSKFANLQAVKNDRIYELPASYMEWQGRTIITAANTIAGLAFPDLLEENTASVTLSSEPESSLAPSPSPAASSEISSSALAQYTELKQGDSSDEVLEMQQRLDELGYLDTEYDGQYGEYTAQCVKDFQKANGLEETGTADPKTQYILFSKNAKAKGGDVSPAASSGASSASSAASSSEPENP